jgi:htpN
MHNVEAQALNSDFEDYIESKANLRELQLKEFLNQFFPELNVNSVLIYGSTE